MKKVIMALLMGTMLVGFTSCTNETDEDLEILSPDKETPPPGSGEG